MKLLIKIIFFVSILLSCNSKEEKTQPIIENISESVYASGIIKSKNQYQVFSTVNGLIKEILVKEGEVVKKGDPIIWITSETSKLTRENAQLEANNAKLSANKNKLNELKINIELNKNKVKNDSILLLRQQNLWKEKIGTQNELEQKELAYKNGVTNYQVSILRYDDLQKQLTFAEKQSQNNLQISTALLEDYTIKSAINGIIYRVLKEKGEIVNTQSALATIGDEYEFEIELQVDEYDIAKIKPTQKLLLNMESYKGQVFIAKIKKIHPIMDERSRSFTIDAEFVTKPPALYPNLTTEANIIIQTKEKALTIPRTYLIDETYVKTEDGEKRKVNTGLKDYEKVEILDGLTATDVIIKPKK